MRRIADGGVREVGRRRRRQNGRGRELQGRVRRGAPRRYNCEGKNTQKREEASAPDGESLDKTITGAAGGFRLLFDCMWRSLD